MGGHYLRIAMPSAYRAATITLALTMTACSYRFANPSIAPPPTVRSIAVEAVFDTGRRVLPHDLLWDSLQEAIIVSGKLRLAAPQVADAYLRDKAGAVRTTHKSKGDKQSRCGACRKQKEARMPPHPHPKQKRQGGQNKAGVCVRRNGACLPAQNP